jgi:hypothetical protein
VTTPNPPGATGSYLNGVSCTSATECIAVGDYTNRAGNYLTLAEVWNGHVWRIQPTANPVGASDSRLEVVPASVEV